MTALLLSTVLPYLVTKFGGMLVSNILIKVGAGQAAASAGGNIISQIAAKLGAGKPLAAHEKAAWNSHFQSTYQQPVPPPVKPVEVASAAGVPFANS